MEESSSSSSKPLILLVIVLPLLFSNPSSGQYLAISCDARNVTYEINSPFHNNLNLLLQSLSEKTVEYNGFYRSWYGDGSDKVNGRALCRGDVTPAECKTCLTNATRQLLAECKEQSAAIWLDKCQIDYSYGSLVSDYGGKYPNSEAEEEAGDRARFCDALGKMFPRLSEAAGRSELMFAYAKVGFSGKETLYGLVQCTRDIAPRTCDSCLDSAFHDFGGCDESARGGAVLSRTCSLRFQLYRFFDDDDDGRKNKRRNKHVGMAIGVSVTIFVVAIAGFLVLSRWRRSRANRDVEKLQDNFAPVIKEEIGRFTPGDLPFMEFSVVEAATDNFSCKLGEGGFGTVYKGVLADGKEIAVKRLSRRSWQGSMEFMNEIGIIAKLQHRNLVRLLSCSLQGSEKLLIYEYVPNKSLDLFLFDREKRSMLDWNTRIKIITGIARGLVYLHEESRIKIVHRDLKPSNVLLDSDMSAKISDFGLARIFCDNQNLANTNRVVGTYGYMAPEYAMEGVFSVKSDVFSFGVMLLEIIRGERNYGLNHGQTLLAYAWEVWKGGKEVELVDPMLREKCPMHKVKRCIQIGLVCVQGDAEERPSMSQVVALLESQVAELPHPNKPAFSAGKDAVAAAVAAAVALEEPRSAPVNQFSVNQMTISTIMPR